MFGSTPQRECLNVVPLSVLKAICEYTWNQVTKMYYSVALPLDTQSYEYSWGVCVLQNTSDGNLHHKSQASLSLCLITLSQRYLRAIICHILSLLCLCPFEPWYEIVKNEKWKKNYRLEMSGRLETE